MALKWWQQPRLEGVARRTREYGTPIQSTDEINFEEIRELINKIEPLEQRVKVLEELAHPK